MKRKGRRPEWNEGFTLLEALVALAVLGLVGVSALTALGAELRGSAKSREALASTAVAEEVLARASLLPEGSLLPLPDSLRKGSVVVDRDTLRWTAKSAEWRNAPALVELSVTVEGRTLTTLVARRP